MDIGLCANTLRTHAAAHTEIGSRPNIVHHLHAPTERLAAAMQTAASLDTPTRSFGTSKVVPYSLCAYLMHAAESGAAPLNGFARPEVTAEAIYVNAINPRARSLSSLNDK